MRVLITGATGFIGKHLCLKLIADNHEVMAVSRTGNDSLNDFNNRKLSNNIIWLHSTLQISSKNLEAIAAFSPEVLIHLAWEKIPDFSFDISYENLQNQLFFFRNILTVSSIRKVISAGSCWEYNKNFGQCRIDESCLSKDYFTWAKNSIHDFLRFECETKNISLCWARIFYVYGPYQREGSLVPTLIRSICSGSVPDLRSPANANDFIYIDDVVSAFMQMVNQPDAKGIYNIGSGRSTSNINICRMVEISLKSNTTLSDTLAERTANIPASSDFWADIESSHTLLNWTPVVTMQEGIKQMIQFIK